VPTRARRSKKRSARTRQAANEDFADLRAQNPSSCIVLVGNKVDIESKEVSQEDASKLRARLDPAGYTETSAKIGEGIEDLTTEVILQITRLKEEHYIAVQRLQTVSLDPNPAIVALDSPNRRCCGPNVFERISVSKPQNLGNHMVLATPAAEG
jgi:50S ribosomal subunit-associated GTPase HflX